MKKLLLIIIVSASLLHFGCAKDNDDLDRENDNLKSLQIGDYTMQVPEEFTLVEGTGIDSYIGTISGNGIEIKFDYGSWNVPPQQLESEEYEVQIQTFGSVERYLLISHDPRESTGIHIRDLDKIEHGNYVSLQMAANGLTKEEQNLVVKIFESVVLIDRT